MHAVPAFRCAPAVSFRANGSQSNAMQGGWSEAVSASSPPLSAEGVTSRVGDGPPVSSAACWPLLPGGRTRDAPARAARLGPSGLPAARIRLRYPDTRCADCGSYRLVDGTCEHCGWIDPDYEAPDVTPKTKRRRKPTSECTPNSDISTFMRPEDLV
jgi:hypothetical protein